MNSKHALWLLVIKADGYDWSLTQFDDNFNFVIMKRNYENTEIVEANDCEIDDTLDTAKERFDKWILENQSYHNQTPM